MRWERTREWEFVWWANVIQKFRRLYDIRHQFSLYRKKTENLPIDIRCFVFLSFRDFRRSEKFSLNCRPKMENSSNYTIIPVAHLKRCTEHRTTTTSHKMLRLDPHGFRLAHEMCRSWRAPGYFYFVVLWILLCSLLHLVFFFIFDFSFRVTFVGCRTCRSVKFFSAQRQNQTVMSITACRLL